jgi:hypothetical protein
MMKKLIIISLLLLPLGTVIAQENRSAVLQDLENNQSEVQEASLTATLKSASRLFGEKDDLTTVIMIIPSGSVVGVLGSDSTYLKVIFEETEGYIFKRHAVISEPENVSKPVVQKREAVQYSPPESQQQVSRFTSLENKYGSNMAAKLVSGKIWKGMSAEMVRDSWGNPQKINRVINGNTIKEEWIFKNTWLFIQNDYLVEWGPITK